MCFAIVSKENLTKLLKNSNLLEVSDIFTVNTGSMEKKISYNLFSPLAGTKF